MFLPPQFENCLYNYNFNLDDIDNENVEAGTGAGAGARAGEHSARNGLLPTNDHLTGMIGDISDGFCAGAVGAAAAAAGGGIGRREHIFDMRCVDHSRYCTMAQQMLCL
jgi:hypothetical protein